MRFDEEIESIDVKLVSSKKRTIQNGYSNQALCNTKYLTMILFIYVKTKLHQRLASVHKLECAFWN